MVLRDYVHAFPLAGGRRGAVRTGAIVVAQWVKILPMKLASHMNWFWLGLDWVIVAILGE